MKPKLSFHCLLQRKPSWHKCWCKIVYLGAVTWENGRLSLKDHFPFLLKPVVLIGIGRGEFFFSLPKYLVCFWHTGNLSMYLFSSWALRVITIPPWCFLTIHHVGRGCCRSCHPEAWRYFAALGLPLGARHHTTHPGKLVGVPRAPLDARTHAFSLRSSCGPHIPRPASPKWPAPSLPCCQLPVLPLTVYGNRGVIY